jgi:hypothetical protein
MTLSRQRFDACVTGGSDNVYRMYSEKDYCTSSHDFLLSRATMALIILMRKLK